jgi:hypothetical protein
MNKAQSAMDLRANEVGMSDPDGRDAACMGKAITQGGEWARCAFAQRKNVRKEQAARAQAVAGV